jgi:hypothetical protein
MRTAQRRLASLLLGLALAVGFIAGSPGAARASDCADLAGAIFYHSEQKNYAYQTVLLNMMYDLGCF